MLVEAIASMCPDVTFIYCSGLDLRSRGIGNPMYIVKQLMLLAISSKPAILCIDHIEYLIITSDAEGRTSIEDRFELAQQLFYFQASKNRGAFVVGICSTPHCLRSPAIRRFARMYFVSPPDETTRAMILRLELNRIGKHTITDSQVRQLAIRVDGYSGSDLKRLVTVARSVSVLNEPICMSHMLYALSQSNAAYTIMITKRFEEAAQSVPLTMND
jgi:SpoVK/Ycf46/Vps4 family AAA+-type ATPase